MDEEKAIRELIGRLRAAQRQGLHVTPAPIALVLPALCLFLQARVRVAKPNPDPRDDAPRRPSEPYTGPAATIADLRRFGLVAVSVTCEGASCWHGCRMTFDELGLPPLTPVPDIPRWRRFRCRACGCRKVRVSPDWRDHRALGNGLPEPTGLVASPGTAGTPPGVGMRWQGRGHVAQIEFSALYYGDRPAQKASIELALTEMTPLTSSSATGDPVALRVRGTVTEADLKRLTGIGWTDAAVTDAGRVVSGKVSNLEVQDAGMLEFLLTPGV